MSYLSSEELKKRLVERLGDCVQVLRGGGGGSIIQRLCKQQAFKTEENLELTQVSGRMVTV